MANPFQNIGQAIGAVGQTPVNYSQLQNAYPSALTSQQAQAMAAQQFNQYLHQQQEHHLWMINGKRMSFKEFADTLFPDDTPERTMFFLKYSK